MAMLLGLIIAILPSAHAHVAVRGGRSFLATGMQPEVVAHTLASVEEEWKAQAAVFAQCSMTASDVNAATSIVNCQDAPDSFGKSCRTVVAAIVQGSSGDKRVANEYMVDVCGQKSIEGWHRQQCQSLAHAVTGAMSADAYNNRNSFDSTKLCTSFWSTFLKEEQKRLAEEKAAREAAEKKAAEEEKIAREAAEKKAQEEAAEQARKAEENRKLEEERRKVEEQRRQVEEAARLKAEAEAKAKAAAEKAAQKKAEAEAEAKAAKLKLQEAEEAEKEHEEAQAKMAKEAVAKKVVEKKTEKVAEKKEEKQVVEKKAEKQVVEKKTEKQAVEKKVEKQVVEKKAEKQAVVEKKVAPAPKKAAVAAGK